MMLKLPNKTIRLHLSYTEFVMMKNDDDTQWGLKCEKIFLIHCWEGVTSVSELKLAWRDFGFQPYGVIVSISLLQENKKKTGENI